MVHPIRISYHDDIEILYIELSDEEIDGSKEIDVWRNVDLAADGSIVGIEFVNASIGINVEGIPRRSEIEAALKRLGSLRIQPHSNAGVSTRTSTPNT